MKIFIALFLSTLALSAHAQNNQPRCYLVEVDESQSPANLDLNEFRLDNHSEVWCYQDASEGTWLFNRLDTREESTFLIQNGGKQFVQASRVHDELSYHTTNYNGVSPVGDFLLENEIHGQEMRNTYHLSTDEFSKLNKLKEQFIQAAKQRNNYQMRRRLFDGANYSNSIPEEKYPFYGYWWPHNGLPLAGDHDSPLQKYDRMVEARTGTNPNSAEWENRVHSLQHVSWGGHCNGWAASSVLHKEPRHVKQDPISGEIINISDFKGMLAEASFCVKWAFYGRRYNDNDGDDISDLHADRFHKVILYYIDQLQKPIAHDYVTGSSVDNNVISGYDMTVLREGYVEDYGLGDNEYLIKMNLQNHYYGSRNEMVGKAGWYYKNYEYIVTVDATGSMVSARWVSDYDHSDFLWVPLYQKKCGRENPRIDHNYIVDWAENLPDYVPPAPEPEDCEDGVDNPNCEDN